MKFTKSRLDFLSRLHSYLQWRKRTLCAVIFAALSPVFAHANPDGAQIISGQVSIDQSVAGITTVTNSPNAIINWQNFNIAQNEITRFVQQNGQSAVLNRIIGGNPSEILGSLFSNGKVFLINPNGIVFGTGSQIDTQGLLASTLNLSDESFKRGNFHFVAGSKSGDITNEGIIHAGKDGNVVLIAPNIQNNGIIKSEGGKIVLAAGQELVLTSLDDPEIRFQVQSSKNRVLNIGQLLTEGGAINVFAGTLKHSGDISADSVEVDKQGNIRLVAKGEITLEKDSKTSANNEQGEAGKIEITGENVAVLNNSKIEAVGKTGGGEILIGGDYQGKNPAVQNAQTTTVAEKVEIKADAKTEGKGGKVVVWSDNETKVAANISAKGGKKSGNGGLVETSGKQLKIADTTKVSTKAAKGKSGTWLLDPLNFTIAAGLGTQTNANIGADTLSANLGGGNVTIATDTTTGAEGGDIIVNAPVSWSANKLTLNAFRNIDINATLDGSGTAQLALEYGQSALASGNTATYNVRAPVNLPQGSNFSTKLGSDTTAVDYYVITSLGVAGDSSSTTLQGMKNALSGKFALGANIDASVTSTWNSGEGFYPVGNATTPFTSKFDGLGHTISNLTVNRPTADYIGLFGSIYNTASVQHLGISGSVNGGGRVGALAGVNDGSVSNVYSAVDVSGVGGSVGGLIGENTTNGEVLYSYSTGTVSGGTINVGGLIGGNWSGLISNSYSTGTVSTSSVQNVGGLLGFNDATVTNSFWDTQTSGQATSAGGTGLTTAQMMTQSNFTGFDFTNTWWMSEGNTRPFLRSEWSTNITNAHQLQLMASNLSANYTLANNLDLSAELSNAAGMWNTTTKFVPIGNNSTPFTGSFDGLNNTISGLTINRSTNYVGVFGYSSGTIQNVGLTNVNVTGSNFVGGLLGWNLGNVSNSYSTGVMNGLSDVGGLLGWNVGNVSNSYSTGAVSGIYNVGGLLGLNDAGSGSVNNSYSTGVVSGQTYIGGLVGINSGSVSNSYSMGTAGGGSYIGGLAGSNAGSVSNSYSTTAVNGGTYIGGLLGWNSGSVSNSYSTGVVSGIFNVGGLIGDDDPLVSGTVTNSFWDTQTSGQATSAGGTGKTTAEMMSASTLTALGTPNWSGITDTSYPYLSWQFATAPQIISGTLAGSSISGKSIAFAVDGVPKDVLSTGANGFFYQALPANSITSSQNVLAWLDNDTNKAATLTNGSYLTDLKLELDTVFGQKDLDTIALQIAKGTISDTDIPFSFNTATPSVLSPTVGILKANNDIILNNSITTNGSISLKAGKSVLLGTKSISSSGGDIEIIANETVANGIVNSHRDAGQAVIQMQAGSNLDAGLGVGGVAIMLRKRELDTPNNAGAITLTTVTGGNINIDNAGTYNATDLGSGDVVLNGTISTNSPTSTGKNLSISSSHDISVNAYLNTGITTAGATIGNGGNLSLTAGNDISLNLTGNTLLSNVQTDGNSTHTGNAGNITLLANRNITGVNSDINASVAKFQYGSTGGHAGNVSLTATTGSVLVRNIETSAFQNDTGGTIGRGGDVSITSGTDLSVNGIHALSYGATYNSSATTLSGGGNVFLDAGQNLTIPANGYIDTQTVNQGTLAATINDTSGSVTLKAKGDIVLNSNVPILASNDAVVLNSNSDGVNDGAIKLTGSNSITTNGGAITLAGGANASGYAIGSTANHQGVFINTGSTLNSGGGDVTILGQGGRFGNPSFNAGYNCYGIELHSSIDSGTGKISISAMSGDGRHALELFSNVTLTSANTTADAISLFGDASFSTSNTYGAGIIFWEPNVGLLATNGGGINLTGIGGSNGTVGGGGVLDGIYLKNTNILASGGSINLDGGVKGTYLEGSTIGYKAATAVTSSNANINLKQDKLTFAASTALQSVGSLTVEPKTASFTSPFTFDPTIFKNGFSSITLGSATNAASLTVNGNVSTSNGAINLFAPASNANITVSGNLTTGTSSANSGAINLKAGGNIVVNASKALTTYAQPVILNSDADANSNGAISLLADANVTTNGGDITFGGGANPLTTPAYGNSTYLDGVLLFQSGGTDAPYYGADLNAGGGNINLRGVGYGSGSGLSGNAGATIATTGTGSINIVGGAGASASYTAVGLDRVYISAQNGDINISGTTAAASNYAIVQQAYGEIKSTGTGAINISGSGADGILLNNSAVGGTSASGNIMLTTDKITISGTTSVKSTGGALTVKPATANTIGIAGGAGTLQLPASYFSTNFVNGFSNINIGSSTVGDISVGTTALTYNDPLTLKTAGSITVAANEAITGAVGGNNSLTLWSSAGNNYAGNITLNAGSSINTNGGDILFRGGTGTLNTVSNPIDASSRTNFITELLNTGAGKSVNHGINLIGTNINAGGGNIEMRAASNYVGIDAISSPVIRTSGAGNIALYGLGGFTGAVNSTHGIHTNAATIETTGTGNLTMYGVNKQATGGGNPAVWLVSSTIGTHGTTSGNLSITGYSTESATSANSSLGWNNEGVTVQSSTVNTTTATGSINITGHGGNGNKWNMGVKVRDVNSSVSLGTSSGTMTVMGMGGTCTLIGSCWGIVAENGGSFVSQGTGSINLIGTGGTGAGTDNYGIKTNITSTSHIGSSTMTGNVILTTDTIDLDLLPIQSLGTLTVQPQTLSTPIGIAGGTGTLQIPTSYFATNFVNGFSNINIGNTSTGAMTLGTALTVPTSANLTLQNAGNMAFNGALTLAANKTLTLNSTGDVTQSAPIIATNLLLLGTGNFTINNINNVISNLAATGVNNLNFVNSTAFAIDSVAGTNGIINATGTIDISSYNGNLTVNQPVRTSNTTADALKLNAGSIETTSTTANILVGASGNDVFSVGTGGIAKFFTGSISGSTGLATLIGSGSGRFRYNSDESIAHYTTQLLPYDANNATTTGLYAIYRETPSVSFTVPETYSSIYNAQPVSLPITLNNAQFPNGDGMLITPEIAQAAGAMPSLGIKVNDVSAGLPINAGTYSVTVTPISAGDFFGGLGYSITPTDLNSSVTISPAALNIIANTLSKTYGGVDPTLTYVESGLISGDTLTGSLSRDTGEAVGIYPINQGSLNAGTNYTINYTPANLTINALTSGGGEVVIPNDPPPITPPQPTPEEIAAQLEAERLVVEAEAKLEAEKLAAEAAAKLEAEQLAAEAAAKLEVERLAAEAAAKLEAERLAAEAAAKAEAERLATEAAAKAEAERLATEAAVKLEAERLAAEAAVKAEAERLAAEVAAKAEAERLAAEVAAKAEAERLAAEAAVKAEAERLAAEAAAKAEAERLAAEAEAKLEAERLAAETVAKLEAERLAVEAAAKLEVERLAAEAAAKLEAERLAAEAAAKAEAERLAAEAAAKLEAERLAGEAAAKLEAERLAAEAAKLEAERLAAEAAAKAEAERLAAEAAAKLEVERLAAEAAAKLEAERLAAEAAAKLEAERLAAEAAAKLEAERLAAEAAAKAEAERLAAEAAAKAEAERLAAEVARIEAERLAAEVAAKAEAERLAAEVARIEAERLAAEVAAKAEAERLAAEAAVKLEAERLAAEAAAKAEAERLATEILNKPSTTGSTGINTETLVKNLGEALKDTPPEQVKEVVQKVEENVGNQTTTVLTMSAQQIAEPTSGSTPAPTTSSAEKTSATDSTTLVKSEKQDKDDKKEDKKDKKADVVIAATGADSKAAKPLQQCK